MLRTREQHLLKLFFKHWQKSTSDLEGKLPVRKTPFTNGQKPITGATARNCIYRYKQEGFFHLFVELEDLKK